MILKRLRLYVEENHITNCYIIVDEETKETMVVDPGAEPDKISNMLDVLGVSIKYIVLTHCHADHTGGVTEIKKQYGR